MMPGERAIYVLGATRSTVELKIGYSADPHRRALEVRSYLGHDIVPLDVYRVPGCTSNKVAWHVEHALHAAIEAAGFYRKHGGEVFSRSAFEASQLRRWVRNYALKKGWQRVG